MPTSKIFWAHNRALAAIFLAAIIGNISGVFASAHAGAQKRINPFSIHHESRTAKAIRKAHGSRKIGIFTPQLKALKFGGRSRRR